MAKKTANTLADLLLHTDMRSYNISKLVYFVVLLLFRVREFSIKFQFSYCNILGACPIDIFSKVPAIPLQNSRFRP